MRDVFAKLFKAVGLYLRHFIILWVLDVLIALEPHDAGSVGAARL